MKKKKKKKKREREKELDAYEDGSLSSSSPSSVIEAIEPSSNTKQFQQTNIFTQNL
jgi:hypothetical protein